MSPKHFLRPLTILLLVFISSCELTTSYDSYYIVGSKEQQETLKELFRLLNRETSPGEEQFSVVREIANELLSQQEYAKLINFLTDWVASHPDDPYNGYLLLMVAYSYMKQDAGPVAAIYFNRILTKYSDLLVKGESIHFQCLKQLIQLDKKPEHQIRYYKELIARFPEKIDLGIAHFMLAQAYEKTGEWDTAIQTYSKFLPYYSSSIPGFPDARGYAMKLVDYYNSPKDWTFDSLESLMTAVKQALDSGSSRALRQLRAKVNFFAVSWGQDTNQPVGMDEFNLSDFMAGKRIRYSDSVDASSNANEAYLKTWGWTQRITTWYLYFRKIYFPADPEIHGRWEWAGVYYGEKF